ncbi:MAG: hypothetical protein US75_C0028G0015 [Candidatus Woesebacteria bacterium GW2011_GWC1_38_13]|uniref:4-amino-4-deoxy-L-arabinose transferase and related glycosyltransferases of PMT family n=2 Tax=Candidatus Woeseibacteriota TaxID=1752722 RepID=A0A0G0KUS9_9BACT|nr:MAG: hypothetical protein US75_C0028G0015 [Candidatus Woesebacteria bacterium GW2011_GWC1_38_13]KKQ83443.1 MAG: 4-amino-4-deoxy-L-arabinose transferase and related glycosyltransferases of PMT family [Candidatus Woesebacteria bacterium GW2011_GWA1_38_8]
MANLRSLIINQRTLIIILLLAAFLRLYKLDNYPAFNADEAAIGYNAYSLLETGKDEHGNPWPIHFQSFNDYKPGLYVYLVMPFVKIIGLNEWSVRFPNALLGIASVYLIYLLVREMVNGQWLMVKKKSIINDQSLAIEDLDSKQSYLLTTNHQLLAIIASFLLAISPWHLHFSRGGWEVNTATFFIMLGVYFFLKYISKKRFLFIVSCLLFLVLSMYSYHSARIISPLLFFGLLTLFWKEINLKIKQLMILGLIGFLFSAPLIVDLTKSDIVSRAAGVGLFADTGPIERTNEQRMEHAGVVSRIFHNKATNYGLTFLKNWGEHYHGLFLFVSGDEIQRNRVPETGQMYLFEIITVILGLCVLFSRIIQNSKFIILILYWLLIAPIPASMTFQSPHSLRAQNMVIPLTIISAIGLAYLTRIIHTSKPFFRFAFYILLTTVIVWSFSRYLHMYYVHMSKEYPYSSQYGVKELINYIEDGGRTFKNIVVTNKYDQPYILFLFYTKYPPQLFQKEHILTPRDKYGFSTVDQYSNFIFKSIDWDSDKLLYPDSLIIGSNEEIPDETNITKKIYGSNGYLYFKVVVN